MVTRCKRYRRPLSVLSVDIDHFKSVNDTWGHEVGDEVLRLVGQCLPAGVEQSALCARLSGEELVVLLPETELSEAARLAEALRERVEHAAVSVGDDKVHVTISLGCAQWRRREEAPALLKRADKKLYDAKHDGRNESASRERPRLDAVRRLRNRRGRWRSGLQGQLRPVHLCGSARSRPVADFEQGSSFGLAPDPCPRRNEHAMTHRRPTRAGSPRYRTSTLARRFSLNRHRNRVRRPAKRRRANCHASALPFRPALTSICASLRFIPELPGFVVCRPLGHLRALRRKPARSKSSAPDSRS